MTERNGDAILAKLFSVSKICGTILVVFMATLTAILSKFNDNLNTLNTNIAVVVKENEINSKRLDRLETKRMAKEGE